MFTEEYYNIILDIFPSTIFAESLNEVKDIILREEKIEYIVRNYKIKSFDELSKNENVEQRLKNGNSIFVKDLCNAYQDLLKSHKTDLVKTKIINNVFKKHNNEIISIVNEVEKKLTNI